VKKLALFFLLFFAFASPALSEIRSIDITIFGMD
jgi:hypothetical protein